MHRQRSWGKATRSCTSTKGTPNAKNRLKVSIHVRSTRHCSWKLSHIAHGVYSWVHNKLFTFTSSSRPCPFLSLPLNLWRLRRGGHPSLALANTQIREPSPTTAQERMLVRHHAPTSSRTQLATSWATATQNSPCPTISPLDPFLGRQGPKHGDEVEWRRCGARTAPQTTRT